MKVTNVRLRRIENKNRLKAVATITFNDMFVVHELRLIEGQNGLFVAMPSRRHPSGEFRDICHPITKELRAHVEEVVISKYHELGEQLAQEAALEISEDESVEVTADEADVVKEEETGEVTEEESEETEETEEEAS